MSCEWGTCTSGGLTERMTKGDNFAIGDGVRLVLPSDHVIELYSEAEYVGTDVGLTRLSEWWTTSTTIT